MVTSKLQQRTSDFLSVHFGGYTIRENYMAEWLITPDGGRLQLDFYIEELRKAIEVQGIQHFRFTPHFHITEQGFERRQYLDAFKRDACEARDIELVEVCDEADVINLVQLKPISQEKPFIPTDMAAMRKLYTKARDADRAYVRVTEKTRRLHFIMQMIAHGIWSDAEKIVLKSWAIKCITKINMNPESIAAIQRQYSVDLTLAREEYDGEFKMQLTECSARLRPLAFAESFKQPNS